MKWTGIAFAVFLLAGLAAATTTADINLINNYNSNYDNSAAYSNSTYSVHQTFTPNADNLVKVGLQLAADPVAGCAGVNVPVFVVLYSVDGYDSYGFPQTSLIGESSAAINVPIGSSLSYKVYEATFSNTALSPGSTYDLAFWTGHSYSCPNKELNVRWRFNNMDAYADGFAYDGVPRGYSKSGDRAFATYYDKPACGTPVCTLGDKRCNPSTPAEAQSCVSGISGCPEWQSKEYCSAPLTCSAGACVSQPCPAPSSVNITSLVYQQGYYDVLLNWTKTGYSPTCFQNYAVKRSDDGGVTYAIVDNEPTITTVSAVIAAPNADTNYGFIVDVCSKDARCASSQPKFVKTPPACNAPTAPQLAAPAAANITQTTATFTWGASQANCQITYSLEAAPNGGAYQTKVANISSTAATASGLSPNAAYSARVLARTSAGQNYSNVVSFTTKANVTAPSTPPTRVSPAHNAEIKTCTGKAQTVFSWLPVATATYYVLNVYYSNGSKAFNASVSQVVNGTLSYNYSLPLGTNYAWNVMPCNDAGCNTGNMDYFSVVKGSAECLPAVPVLISPADGGVSIEVVNFSWSSPQGATHYLLFVRDADGKEFNYSLGGAESLMRLPPNTYYWYVFACNDFGCSSTSSDIRSFRLKSGQCSSGECCDAEKGLFKAVGTACGPKTYEYSCNGTAPGNALLGRSKQAVCSGVASFCGSQAPWGDWTLSLQCNNKQYCDSSKKSCETSCMVLNWCYDNRTIGVQTAECKVVPTNKTCKSGCFDGACKGDAPVISNVMLYEPVYADWNASFSAMVVDGEENIRNVILNLKDESGTETIVMKGGNASGLFRVEKFFGKNQAGRNFTYWVEAVDEKGNWTKSEEKTFTVDLPLNAEIALSASYEVLGVIAQDCVNGEKGACESIYGNKMSLEQARNSSRVLLDTFASLNATNAKRNAGDVSKALDLVGSFVLVRTVDSAKYYKTKNFRNPVELGYVEDLGYVVASTKSGLKKRTSFLPEEVSKIQGMGNLASAGSGAVVVGIGLIDLATGENELNSTVYLVITAASTILPDYFALGSTAGLRLLGSGIAAVSYVSAAAQLSGMAAEFVMFDLIGVKAPHAKEFIDDFLNVIDPGTLLVCAVTSPLDPEFRQDSSYFANVTKSFFDIAAKDLPEEVRKEATNVVISHAPGLQYATNPVTINCIMPNAKSWAPYFAEAIAQAPDGISAWSIYLSGYVPYSIFYSKDYNITVTPRSALEERRETVFDVNAKGMLDLDVHVLPLVPSPQEVLDYFFNQEKKYRAHFGWQVGIEGRDECFQKSGVMDKSEINPQTYPQTYSASFKWTPNSTGIYHLRGELLWLLRDENDLFVTDTMCSGQSGDILQRAFATSYQNFLVRQSWIVIPKNILVRTNLNIMRTDISQLVTKKNV